MKRLTDYLKDFDPGIYYAALWALLVGVVSGEVAYFAVCFVVLLRLDQIHKGQTATLRLFNDFLSILKDVGKEEVSS